MQEPHPWLVRVLTKCFDSLSRCIGCPGSSMATNFSTAQSSSGLCCADVTDGSTVHLVMRPLNKIQAPLSTSGAEGSHQCWIKMHGRCADVTDGSTVHLVMRPVDTTQAPPPASGAEGPHHHFGGPMGGVFPVAFRGGPNGGIDPNDFGSVSKLAASVSFIMQQQPETTTGSSLPAVLEIW